MERRNLYIVLAIALSLATYFTPLGLNQQAQTVLAILILAGALWFTEAIPLHATSLVIAFTLIVFAGITPSATFFPFFDPVIVLLLGGFILAVAMQKHGLDYKIAATAVRKIGNNPSMLLLGMMCIAAFLSMWMSNTATTAVMIPIMLVILKENKLKPLVSNYGKAAVLGIAFAATLGGIGTLVGTTPNPIAAKFLADAGIVLTFTDWPYYALPLVLILLPLQWIILLKAFKPEIKKVTFKSKSDLQRLTPQQKQVLFVFVLTALLWLTEKIHGYKSSVIALVPIILLYLLRNLETKDFEKAHWNILILVGGGLSLGSAMTATGVSTFLAGLLQNLIIGQPYFIILLAVAIFTIGFTVLASNTATAAILIPIMVPLATNLNVPILPLVLVSAMAASLDFIVPVGTPPSAIAYGTGYVRVKDMAKVGIIISLLGAIVVSGLAFLYW
ncbi:MAG: DASS family sodium-coupled anion symporter [Candidatus Diapherotrites archaeon]|nr:DASS family sodium-coupled anion symporter [Candidatus Diapherotrites archaeon]